MYRFGILRTSPKLNKIFGVAIVAYLLFMLVNIGYMLMVGDSLRTGWIGLVIGGLAVAMASYSLVMDFEDVERADRKSTRLNSSHVAISYAVFCLKKKKTTKGGSSVR